VTDRGTRRDINPLFFLGATLRSALAFPPNALGMAARLVVNQIRFTAVQALPILLVTAVAVGVPLVLTVAPLTSGLGLGETVDRVVITLVVQAGGPVVAALLVVVRSGTAVVAELATARITGERQALEALGVDALQYYVLPRAVAFGISVALLAIFFDVIVLGALAFGRSQAGEGDAFSVLVRASLDAGDMGLTVLKGLVIGVGVAVFPCMEGLEAGDNATNIPVAVSRGTLQAFLWVLFASSVFAAVAFLA
jgi:phospholipid/cholesterol/gamma-HCH transport system permease protein